MIPIEIKDLPNEEWREIAGYDGKYFVSNMGRVKSLQFKNEKLLTAFVNNKGYARLCLSKNGKAKHFLVSRLVAQAFCPNPDPESCTTVDHIDSNHLNNCASNLRWMSQRDNYNAYSEKVKKEYEHNTQAEKQYH